VTWVAGRLGQGGPRTLSLVVVAVCAACSSRAEIPTTSPFYGSSLPPYDALVRHNLLEPSDEGVEALRARAPRDSVVGLLNQGLLLHRSGRFAESNTALQRAEALATSRYTRSVTQDVASLIVSDNAVDFQASALERSMIHYYGMLNYLGLGNAASALVEARRANALLRRYSNDFPNRSFVNDAAVQYLAGMLQWGQREENDAIVSLRQSLDGYQDYEPRYGVSTPKLVAIDAARIASAVGLDDVAEQTRQQFLTGQEAELEQPAGDREMGDVVLVIENGFIAHKRQQKLFIPILKSERDSVLAGSASSAVGAAFRVLVRTVIVMNDMGRQGQSYVQAHEDGVAIFSGALSAVGMELVTMSWPVYELDGRRARTIRVETADGRSVEPALIEDLSAIAVRDFEERKTTMLLRMVSRTLLREAGIVQSENAGTRAGGVLGGLAARVAARTVVNATEQADTRSWSGLPAELLVARFRLPEGEHDLRVTFQGVTGPETRVVRIDVKAASVTLRSVALYGRDVGDRSRFSQATRDVEYRTPPQAPRGEGRRDRL